jgi:hypothetical protein
MFGGDEYERLLAQISSDCRQGQTRREVALSIRRCLPTACLLVAADVEELVQRHSR